MNASPHDEFRRVRRRKVEGTIQVVDTMTDTVVGRLGNLSETGMLLIASAPLVEDALYQFRFILQDTPRTSLPIEVGVHLLWQEQTSASGQTWTGLRFITMVDSQMQQLLQWLDGPEGTFE